MIDDVSSKGIYPDSEAGGAANPAASGITLIAGVDLTAKSIWKETLIFYSRVGDVNVVKKEFTEELVKWVDKNGMQD